MCVIENQYYQTLKNMRENEIEKKFLIFPKNYVYKHTYTHTLHIRRIHIDM